jgi:drug/metabolite transporter (DMT)-like permease
VTAVSPLVAVAASRAAGLILIVPFALRFGARVPRGLRGVAVLTGGLETMGFILIVTALTIGPVATASVLAAQFATFAVLLGLIVGRERPARVQLAGVVLTIVAVTILALA